MTDFDQEFDDEFKRASDMQLENNSPTEGNDEIDSEPTMGSYDPYLDRWYNRTNNSKYYSREYNVTSRCRRKSTITVERDY